MRRERNDFKYLWDMQDAGRNAMEFCRGQSLESLGQKGIFQSALERALQSVGEAARHVSAEFKARQPEFQWIDIEKTRHILAHNGEEVDYDILWRVATVHLPVVLAQIDAILGANPPESCSD